MLVTTAIFLLAIAVNQVPAKQISLPAYAENIDNEEAWNARIVSGWRARPGQHPHMISMRMVNNIGRVQACGGSIMSRQWIVTAAHCTATQVTLVIRAGVTNLTQPEFITETQEYYMYPTFNAATPTAVQPNDIALVKLPIPLTYSQNLKPIRIQSSADAHRNYGNLITYASGFGRTWTNGLQTEHLLWVYLRGVSNSDCSDVFTTRFVTDNTICARFFNVSSQSICQGDSGGPLIHISSEGEPILIGISSFVAGLPHGCHSGLPAAFIRPGPFHSWFKEITGIDFENLKEVNMTTTSAPSQTPTSSTSRPITTNSTTFAPNTNSTQIPTSTVRITTVTVPPQTPTNSTSRPITTNSTTFAPNTNSTQIPTSTVRITTVTVPPQTPTNSTSRPITTNSTTFAPNTNSTQIPTSTVRITTVTVPPQTPTNSTSRPITTNSTTFAPITNSTQIPTSTIRITTVTVPPVSVTTLAPSNTTSTPTTTPKPDEEDIDDKDLEELLKRLEVKIKVKVRLSKYLKKKKSLT